MAKKLKNMLSLLLALSMVLSMLCVTAFADEGNEKEGGEAAGISEAGEVSESTDLADVSLKGVTAGSTEMGKIESGLVDSGIGAGSIGSGSGSGKAAVKPTNPTTPTTPTVKVDGTTAYVDSYSGLSSALTSTTTYKNIETVVVTAPIGLTSSIKMPASRTVTLTSENGGYIYSASTSLGSYGGFEVAGKLTLKDIVIDGKRDEGMFVRGSLFIVDGTKAELTMDSGAVIQNYEGASGSYYAFVVRVSSGVFTMNNGSKITNNVIKCDVGAGSGTVSVNGTFNMNGGEIVGNSMGDYSRGQGAAVYLFGTMNMSGGKICGNTANSERSYGGKGGGIYVTSRGNLTMTGGEISGNSASVAGADIYSDGGTVTLIAAADMGNSSFDDWMNDDADARTNGIVKAVDSLTFTEAVALKAGAHLWAEEYTTDEDSHWHVCLDEGCDAVKKADHTPEVIPGVAPTYTSTGLTEGSKCSVCGKILVEQKTLLMRTRPSVTTPAGSDTEIDEPDVPLAEVPLPFVDVADDSEYHDAVAYVYVNDLMDGVEETVFAPDALGNRATVAMALYQLEKAPTVEFTGAFSDVEDGMWYTSAIEWGAANGLIKGYGNGKFGALDSVTREQLAVFLYRYAQLKGYDVSASGSLSEFADGDQVSAWAKDAMSWAVAKELFQADDNGCLNPTAAVSRADIAVVLMQFSENVAK